MERLPRATTTAYERYVARLQNLAHDRPVVIAELGADSRRKGVDVQAELIGDPGARDLRGRRVGHVRVRLDGRVGPQRGAPWTTGTSA